MLNAYKKYYFGTCSFVKEENKVYILINLSISTFEKDLGECPESECPTPNDSVIMSTQTTHIFPF